MSETKDPIETARAFVTEGPKKLFIGGKWLSSQSGKTMSVIDPSTEDKLADVAEAGFDDVDLAVKAARQAFESSSWSGINPHERSRYLLKVAGLIEKYGDELSAISSFEMGMPFEMSKLTTAQMVDVFQYYAGWTTKIFGQTIPTDGASLSYTIREPLGVVGAIIPWNGPILYASWKVGTALATGNTVVLKPAEDAPLTCVRFAEIMEEAGLPPGVVNLVTGPGEIVGDALVAHPDVNKITFTGSTAVGKHIMETAAKTLKSISLELGGKSPFIIFPDADLKKAIPMAVNAFTLNAGQACTAGTRLYIHQNIYQEVSAQIAAAVSQLKLGGPFDPATQIGPIISAKQLDRVSDYIESGKAEGAQLRTGGKRLPSSGYFLEPTVFTDVQDGMKIVEEEIFGPVGALSSFADVAEAVFHGNNTPYGLAASVWTSNLETAHTLASKLQAGIVWINTHFELDAVSPFGGYKQSGLGRELGAESINDFTQSKTVFTRY